jgi:uncharacterized membrane protein YdjX (TVP38/TMEM64 family)
VLIGLAALVGLFLLGKQGGAYLPQFAAWVKSLGFWGPVAYVLGYAVAAVAFLPGSILTLAAGIVFGLAFGTLWAFVGATLGASLAFLVARYGARSWIERKLEDAPKFKAIDRAVAREGFKFVALLRLSPVLPFNLLNYSLGLTKISFPQYVLASFAMLPGTLLYVYYGTLIGDLAALAGGAKPEGGAERWVFLGVGLVATLAVSILLAKKAKQAIAEEVEGG